MSATQIQELMKKSLELQKALEEKNQEIQEQERRYKQDIQEKDEKFTQELEKRDRQRDEQIHEIHDKEKQIEKRERELQEAKEEFKKNEQALKTELAMKNYQYWERHMHDEECYDDREDATSDKAKQTGQFSAIPKATVSILAPKTAPVNTAVSSMLASNQTLNTAETTTSTDKQPLDPLSSPTAEATVATQNTNTCNSFTYGTSLRLKDAFL
jgi:DNA repair exonuclease SbcCD ATPase subunit